MTPPDKIKKMIAGWRHLRKIYKKGKKKKISGVF
jgi:hypothetical protein